MINGVSEEGIKTLQCVFDVVKDVDLIEYTSGTIGITRSPPYDTRVEAVQRTPTKFHVFGLVEFDSVMFVDADTICMGNPDVMFDRFRPPAVYMNPLEQSERHFLGMLFIFAPDLDVLQEIRTVVSGHMMDVESGNFGAPEEAMLTRLYINHPECTRISQSPWVLWTGRGLGATDPAAPFLTFLGPEKPWSSFKPFEDIKVWRACWGQCCGEHSSIKIRISMPILPPAPQMHIRNFDLWERLRVIGVRCPAKRILSKESSKVRTPVVDQDIEKAAKRAKRFGTFGV